jgi:hypothetical protein
MRSLDTVVVVLVYLGLQLRARTMRYDGGQH